MQKYRSAHSRNKAKNLRNLLWIPVGICAVVALLFVFGVLPGERAAVESSPTPGAEVSASLPPFVEETPAAEETLAPIGEQEPEPVEQTGGRETHKPAFKPNTRYDVALTLNDKFKRFSGSMKVYYENVNDTPVYELVFHLHPNAFLTADSPGAQLESRRYTSGFERGQLIVGDVSVNGELAYFSETDDRMLLTVPLSRELMPGEEATVLIEFVLDIPGLNGRFGRAAAGYQLGNFLPVLAVYQQGDWVRESYVALGDPFYAEVADYTVLLRYPQSYTMAATGVLQSEDVSDGMRTSVFEAEQVRDFACMLYSSGVRQAVDTQNGVTVYSYALTDNSAARGLALAKEALAFYGNMLGAYPYKTFTVAQAELSSGGMEYPGLVMIQRELYLTGYERDLALTLYHEVAHQWFYGVVGNDQIFAPWIDEAVACYMGMLPFEENDPETYKLFCTFFLETQAALGGRIDGTLYDYDESAYANSVYWRGGAMLHALRAELGDEAFFAGLKLYVERNAYRVATKGDLVSAFEAASGRQLTVWFEEWLAAPEADANEQAA